MPITMLDRDIEAIDQKITDLKLLLEEETRRRNNKDKYDEIACEIIKYPTISQLST